MQGASPVNWFQRIRLRVLAVVLAGTLAVIGILAWATVPAWPVVGVAIITVAAVVNSMTTRLAMPVCYQCGSALNPDVTGCYGVLCEGCGAVNEVVPSADRQSPRFAASGRTDDSTDRDNTGTGSA
jgi:hypothetical protein